MSEVISIPTYRFRPADTAASEPNAMTVPHGDNVSTVISPKTASMWLVAPASSGTFLRLASAPYNDFAVAHALREKNLEVARVVIRSLRRKEKYMDVYVDYVQGSLTKEEFGAAAKAFSVAPRNVPPADALVECQLALELVGEGDLDANELSVLLDLDTIELENLLGPREQHTKSISGTGAY